MPPPTTGDAWLASRHFGIVIDAGSSGSRLQIYSWKNPRVVRAERGSKAFHSLPNVEKGVQQGDGWISKVEPGISSFGGNPDGVAVYLRPLLDHAMSQVPPSLQPNTPLFLLATAGMRLLPSAQQTGVLKAACDFLKFHSHFRIDDPSSAGPCGASVRIISGEDEGLFGWIAINYLMDGFTGQSSGPTTYGFLDMGGASTQIAFEPSEEEQKKSKSLVNVGLRLLGGDEIHHRVFVTTWLGYGTNQARERYVGSAISHYENERQSLSPDGSHFSGGQVPDPCLPRELTLVETPVQLSVIDLPSKKAHTLVGTGSFEQCLKQVGPLLNKHAPCPDSPCLFNGVHVPHIDFSVSRFIGVSEYWYSSEHVFGLGGAYDYVQYERAASEFCSRDWSDILRQHEQSKEDGQLGGDGEVDQGGHIVSTGKWGENVEIPRLQMQCFKSAWIANVLHEGIGMPRIVDPGGNSTADSDRVQQKAEEKGLGRPTFQSVDVIGDTAISWTLGKMVLEASREVPSTHKDIQAAPSNSADSNESYIYPGGQLFDFDATRSPLSHHFSSFVTRYSLGVSPLGLLFYVACLSFIIIVAYRLRHLMAVSSRRFLRRAHKRDGYLSADQLTLEEGRVANGMFSLMQSLPSSAQSFSASSRWFLSAQYRLSNLISSVRARSVPSRPPQVPPLRHMHSFPARAPPSPPRSFSFPLPSPKSHNGSTSNVYASAAPPRSTTPPAFHRDDAQQANGHMVPGLYTLPRSRNNSQMNLTMLVPRQALSRGGSSDQQTPVGGSYHDGD